MMKHLIAIAVLTIAPSLALAGDTRSDIDGTLENFVTALNAGDAAAVASFYTDDAALLPPGGERVDGREAIQAFWQGAIDGGMKANSLHAVEVFDGGDVAGEVGVFVLTVPADDGVSEIHGKYIVIWERRDGVWQLHRDIWNTN